MIWKGSDEGVPFVAVSYTHLDVYKRQLPVFVVMIKMIVNYYCIKDFQKTQKAKNENLPSKILWSVIAILLVIAYGLPLANITINQVIFLGAFVISLILGIYSFIVIQKFDNYKRCV